MRGESRVRKRDVVETLGAAQDVGVGGGPTFVGGKRETDDGVVIGVLEAGELCAVEAGLAVDPLGLVDEFLAVNGEAERGDESGIADRDAEIVSNLDRGGVLFEGDAVANRRRHGGKNSRADKMDEEEAIGAASKSHCADGERELLPGELEEVGELEPVSVTKRKGRSNSRATNSPTKSPSQRPGRAREPVRLAPFGA